MKKWNCGSEDKMIRNMFYCLAFLDFLGEWKRKRKAETKEYFCMTDKNNYIGKQLTWSQAVELFPDLWVSFKDCEFKGATFIKGILVDVISDNDRIKYMEDHWGEKLHIDRTTEDGLEGYIHGVVVEKES